MSTALTLLIKSPPSEPLRKFQQKSEQNNRLKRSHVSLNGQVFLQRENIIHLFIIKYSVLRISPDSYR